MDNLPTVRLSFFIHALHFQDNTGEDSGVRYVVMINCGATIDLVDFLSPPEDLIIFVADSHRPIDVCNAYSDGQIRLITASEEEEDIPEYGTIFRDESDDNEETGGSDEYDEDDAGREICFGATQVPNTVLMPLRISGRLSLMNYEILRQIKAREQNFLKIHLAL